jgi:hypothetical protein
MAPSPSYAPLAPNSGTIEPAPNFELKPINTSPKFRANSPDTKPTSANPTQAAITLELHLSEPLNIDHDHRKCISHTR